MQESAMKAVSRPYTTHVSDLGFPEGPVLLPDGGIAFVDLLHRKVRVFADGRVRELCTLQGSPNGMRLGADGALYVTNNGGIAPIGDRKLRFADPQISGRIQRVTLDGMVEDIVTGLPGLQPWRPNDLVFSPEGEIVFTDPQNWEVLGGRADAETYHGGQLLAARPGQEARLLSEMTGFPNGLTFHPDGSLLVGLTMEHRIVRFAWEAGTVSSTATWLQLDDNFFPDGMTFHGDRLYVAGSSGDRIAICGKDGRLEEMIDCGAGSDPTNLCIQANKLWVTFGIAGKLVTYDI